MTPGGMGMLAGYARIENPCHDPAALTGARSAAFADVSLHETTIVDGVSRMRPVPRLALAPGRVVTMQPGGLHLMLMQPTDALKAGDHVAIDFTLDDGRTLSGDFVLRAMTP
jgi:copper(I)-binding protein